jgi:hypothetical protein
MIEKKTYIDFHKILPEHHAIDARLTNWARWVKPGSQSWVAPMWSQYRSTRQWEPPIIKDALDTLDAIKIERAVCNLPQNNRDVIRWCYVLRCSPVVFMRKVMLSKQDLIDCLHDGRKMLTNSCK